MNGSPKYNISRQSDRSNAGRRSFRYDGSISTIELADATRFAMNTASIPIP